MFVLDLYSSFLIYLWFSSVVVVILYSVSYVLATKTFSYNKLSVYECGFEPFNLTTIKLNVKFYLIILLFVLFDLEIVFLFPWVLTGIVLGLFGFYVLMFLLVFLLLGFLFEYKKGGLEW